MACYAPIQSGAFASWLQHAESLLDCIGNVMEQDSDSDTDDGEEEQGADGVVDGEDDSEFGMANSERDKCAQHTLEY